MKRKITIHWYNPQEAHVGHVYYITTSQDRAIKLFRRDYDEDYMIMAIFD